MNTNMPPIKVLIVEDDPEIRLILRTNLRIEHYEILESSTLSGAIRRFHESSPTLILLDLGLADGDGLTLISELRKTSSIPILVLSARHTEDEKVACFALGADDYMVKPFGVRELMARIQVTIKRTLNQAHHTDLFQVGDLQINLALGTVSLHGEHLHLTPIEYKLLFCLAKNPGRVFSHRELLSHVWGAEYVNDTHYLRIHMGRLRARIESTPANPRYILTELGIGYRLALQ